MKDANQDEIVTLCRQAHLDVLDLSAVPYKIRYLVGLPDLIVGGLHQTHRIPINVLVEVKTDRGELREAQTDFLRWWRGASIVARTGEDVLRAFGIEGES